MLEFLISPNFWASVLASTTPVLLATLAANIMTKSGLFNLGIEGTMLICALAGVLACGSRPWQRRRLHGVLLPAYHRH